MARRCSTGARSFRPGARGYEWGVGGMVSFISEPSTAPTARGAGISGNGAPTSLGTEVALPEQSGHGPAVAGGMRVLVAFGDEYRAYREAIARALQALRPSTQVTVAPLDAIPARVNDLEPHVVICAGGSDAVSIRNTTWVTVPTEAGVPSSISRGDYYREFGDLSLTELLTVLDGIENSQATLWDDDRPERS